jgi:hypothetical protein
MRRGSEGGGSTKQIRKNIKRDDSYLELTLQSLRLRTHVQRKKTLRPRNSGSQAFCLEARDGQGTLNLSQTRQYLKSNLVGNMEMQGDIPVSLNN